MIFCTVGTQAPFDRLITILDKIAPKLNEEIIAQTYSGGYTPRNIKTVDFLTPNQFESYLRKSSVVVAHAGMGTIISAMKLNIPLIIFPRIAKLGEHRNEHQLATAKKMKEMGYVYVAYSEEELLNLLMRKDLKSLHTISEFAQDSLIQDILKSI